MELYLAEQTVDVMFAYELLCTLLRKSKSPFSVAKRWRAWLAHADDVNLKTFGRNSFAPLRRPEAWFLVTGWHIVLKIF